MIGRFKHVVAAPPAAIVVDMFVAEDGERCGRVRVPLPVRSDLAATWAIYADEPLALALALGLAVIVSASTGLDLYMAGDPKSWDPMWGSLAFGDDPGELAAYSEPALH